jgi:hypothetical protein
VIHRGLRRDDWIRSSQDPIRQVPTQQEEEDEVVVLSDRPTFFHFAPARRPPFAWFNKNLVEDVRPPPFRPVHERLGLSAEEFEARLALEVDSLLEEGRRSRAEELEGDSTTPSEDTAPPLTAMTKTDALRFIGHRALTTGSLQGIFRWAADLGWARYRYDFDLDRDDTNLLEAFD